MRYYSVDEIIAALDIDNRRLKQLRTKLGISAYIPPHDGRLRLFTESDCRKVADLHHQWLAERGRDQVEPVDLRAILATPAPSITKQRTRQTQEEAAAASDLISKHQCAKWAVMHGVKFKTADFWRQVWPADARRTKREALAWAKARTLASAKTRENWRACDDAACPCHTL